MAVQQLTWKMDKSPAYAMKRLGHAQLGAREGAMLYYLARDWYRCEGKIVELGSFLGASASLLGRGIKENPCWSGDQPALHCYDIFEAKFGNMAEFIRERIDPDFRDGDSFLHLFEDQTREFSDTIAIHRGDITDASWNEGAIEILFVDIAKTPVLNAVVFQRFLPNLIAPGGLLVHQDFHNPANPWIHTAMGFLIDYFEIVDRRSDDSALFRLLRKPDPSLVIEAVRYDDLDMEVKLQRLDALISNFADDSYTERYLELTKARIYTEYGFSRQALQILSACKERFGIPDIAEDFFWDRRCEMIRQLGNRPIPG